ncbi:hypothetical protein B7P34_06815 [Streptosporangium nondiastaticum]|uniref:Uncharacterized protein n=1 Tax=Streptosporangium nondiastaticum TaxID=35764 RepID=A0A9X7PIV1_9ACTN|nr:hypothetical protein [Streptosporangium nondiastaticum]PSJ29574.1 hypothetical protein B7P34_06815 [Streptosporangium nondiastaticum]
MTPEETVALTRYVRAICPGQRFDEYTPDAWHDVLAPYNLADARAAVIALVDSGKAFVAVGEITAKVRELRAGRSRHIHGPGQHPEIPDADPDDIPAYLAAVRAQRIRAADPTTRRRPLAELLAATGRHVPKELRP